jgi:hypothetical protein
VIEDMRTAGLAPNVVTFNTLLTCMARQHGGGHLQRAEQVVAQMGAAGLRPSSYTVFAVMRCCRKPANPERAVYWFRQAIQLYHVRVGRPLADVFRQQVGMERAKQVCRELQLDLDGLLRGGDGKTGHGGHRGNGGGNGGGAGGGGQWKGKGKGGDGRGARSGGSDEREHSGHRGSGGGGGAGFGAQGKGEGSGGSGARPGFSHERSGFSHERGHSGGGGSGGAFGGQGKGEGSGGSGARSGFSQRSGFSHERGHSGNGGGGGGAQFLRQ